MTSNQKLRAFGEGKFGSIKAFAEALEMKPPSIQKYLAGESMPGFFILQRLVKYGCDVNWLLSDDDNRSYEQLTEEKIIREVAKTYQDSSYTVKLNKYEANESEYLSFLPKYNRIYIIDSGCTKDMEPLLKDGSKIITDIRLDPEQGDLVLVSFFDNISNEHKYICKYFKEMLNDSIAVFWNPVKENSEIFIGMNTLQFVHKVVFIGY